MSGSSQASGDPSAPDIIAPSLSDALATLATREWRDNLGAAFVIGGGRVYDDAVRHPQCEIVHFTEIQADVECDTHFPALLDGEWQLWSRTAAVKDKDHIIAFKAYVRCDSECCTCESHLCMHID
jgi:dihydrofolate reductase / thymidylate synthase